MYALAVLRGQQHMCVCVCVCVCIVCVWVCTVRLCVQLFWGFWCVGRHRCACMYMIVGIAVYLCGWVGGWVGVRERKERENVCERVCVCVCVCVWVCFAVILVFAMCALVHAVFDMHVRMNSEYRCNYLFACASPAGQTEVKSPHCTICACL